MWGSRQSGRPSEAVVGSRDGDDGPVRRRVVFRIQAVHHESPVQGHLQAGGVTPGHVPLHGQGGSEDQNGATSIFGPGRQAPESKPHGRMEAPVSEVALARHRHGDLPEGDGAQRQLSPPVMSPVFGDKAQEAGSAQGDSDPDLAAIRSLTFQRLRIEDQEADQGQEEEEGGRGGGPVEHSRDGYGRGVRLYRLLGRLRHFRKVTLPWRESTTEGRLERDRDSALPLRWTVGLASLVLVLTGCEPPDLPPVLNPGLPTAAVEFMEPDRVKAFRLDPGVIYREVRSGPHPWVVHLLEVDLNRCELGFQVVGSGDDPGRVPVSVLARRSEPGMVAAINGDFFTPEDEPLGLEATAGAVRGRSARPVFAWQPGNLPWIGPVGWEGDSLQVGSWAMATDDPDGRTEMLGGYPALLSGGRWVGDLQQTDRPAFATQRHPRTGVGLDPWRNRVWLVVVDGRQGLSEGMTLPEFAELFRALGVRDALNLDGGGSSVMVIRGETANRPSDPQGERPVVNALVVRRDPGYCQGWAALPPR